MSKSKQSLAEQLKAKSPQAMRQAIQPVDILAAAAGKTESDEKIEREKRTVSPAATPSSAAQMPPVSTSESQQERTERLPKKSERKKRYSTAFGKSVARQRTEKTRIYSDEAIQSILAIEKRSTERYSFEIYTDQKHTIERLRRLYEQKTGQKLSASRLIREILDSFLSEAVALFDNEEA